jgi:mRNA interferase YafQ
MKQNKDMQKLREVIEKLIVGVDLDQKYHDHQLSGEWKGHRDCHIEPDWILIYKRTFEELILERTGSHSNLFK